MDDPVTPPESKEKIAAAVHPPQQGIRFKDGSEHAAQWQKIGLATWLREHMPSDEVSRRRESRWIQATQPDPRSASRQPGSGIALRADSEQDAKHSVHYPTVSGTECG